MCCFPDFDGPGREAVAYTEDLRDVLPPYINTREDRTVPIQLRWVVLVGRLPSCLVVTLEVGGESE